MKKTSFFILIFILVFSTTLIAAEEDKNKEVPVGMELVTVKDNYKLLVPEGAKIHKEGPVFVLENINEYAARRFHDIEERIVKIEASQEEFKKEIEQLKKDAVKTQKPGLPPENKNQ